MPEPSPRLLLVDDDALFCTAIGDLLATVGITVVCASSLAEARARAESGFAFVVLDDRLPDGRGLDLLDLFARPRARPGPGPRVIVVSAEPDVEMAIAALRCGAVDFLTKPVDLDALLRLVQPGGPAPEPAPSSGEAADEGPALDAELRRLATSDAPMLLLGETGTGKTRLARQLHRASPRARGPFVALNCGALPEALVESELFGSERGAFTGAGASRQGLIESAAGGTFLLDEIGELPAPCQAKLLDVLETRSLRRVGGVRSRQIDVRFMAATHVDLADATRRGGFRSDLLYRLDVLRVELPPLRARPEQLPILVSELLAELGIERPLAAGELDGLAAHGWPGNIRELRNLLQRAAIYQPEGELAPTTLLEPSRPAPLAALELGQAPAAATIEEVALRHMIAIADRSPSRKHAAAVLGIGESTLRRKLRQAAQMGIAPTGRSF